jgi:hypothetical protein
VEGRVRDFSTLEFFSGMRFSATKAKKKWKLTSSMNGEGEIFS